MNGIHSISTHIVDVRTDDVALDEVNTKVMGIGSRCLLLLWGSYCCWIFLNGQKTASYCYHHKQN